MTKKDLIEVVAKKANLTNKAARDAVKTTLNTIRDSLKRGEKVVLTGFGTFSVRSRQQRVGRNPKTGAAITLAARRLGSFPELSGPSASGPHALRLSFLCRSLRCQSRWLAGGHRSSNKSLSLPQEPARCRIVRHPPQSMNPGGDDAHLYLSDRPAK